MDILTDVLNSAGLHKRLLVRNTFYQPWAIRFPCERSIGFHVVTQGEMFIRSKFLKTPIHLKKGDIAFLRRGFEHELATDLKTKVKSVAHSDPPLTLPDKGVALATVVGGAYQLQTEPIHPLFDEMPKTLVLRANEIAAHDPLHSALLLLSAELDQHQAGTESVTKNLLDILFNYILRNWLNRQQTPTMSWSAAMRDKYLQRALVAIHSDLQKDWNLEKLASESGLSRAAFAQKFKQVTGDTPAHYIAQVRIQKAMDMLRTSESTVEIVAEAVGYSDSFVFSKAFKRILGKSPRDYRRELQKGA